MLHYERGGETRCVAGESGNAGAACGEQDGLVCSVKDVPWKLHRQRLHRGELSRNTAAFREVKVV